MVKSLLDNGADMHAVNEVGRCGVLLDGRVRGVCTSCPVHVGCIHVH